MIHNNINFVESKISNLVSNFSAMRAFILLEPQGTCAEPLGTDQEGPAEPSLRHPQTLTHASVVGLSQHTFVCAYLSLLRLLLVDYVLFPYLMQCLAHIIPQKKCRINEETTYIMQVPLSKSIPQHSSLRNHGYTKQDRFLV